MIAAIGSDGRQMVVWGIGDTDEEAREDAYEWCDEEDMPTLQYVKITPQQCGRIVGGDVSCDLLNIPYKRDARETSATEK